MSRPQLGRGRMTPSPPSGSLNRRPELPQGRPRHSRDTPSSHVSFQIGNADEVSRFPPSCRSWAISRSTTSAQRDRAARVIKARQRVSLPYCLAQG